MIPKCYISLQFVRFQCRVPNCLLSVTWVAQPHPLYFLIYFDFASYMFEIVLINLVLNR